MTPLEQLFRLELEFHRRLRCDAHRGIDNALRTSYALQFGYERLMRQVASVTAVDIQRLADQLGLAGVQRDVLAARDSLTQLLGLRSLPQ